MSEKVRVQRLTIAIRAISIFLFGAILLVACVGTWLTGDLSSVPFCPQ